MNEQQHIFLCGFMGCGKSTHGKKLAVIEGRSFFDLDKFIEEKEQTTIQALFDTAGEIHFRDLETHYLKELLINNNNCIIALGGGTVCFNNNIELIKACGLLVYIKMSVESLSERLKKSRQKRPLLKKLEPKELRTFIINKLNEREFFYSQAHLVVNGLGLTSKKLSKLIFDVKK